MILALRGMIAGTVREFQLSGVAARLKQVFNNINAGVSPNDGAGCENL